MKTPDKAPEKAEPAKAEPAPVITQPPAAPQEPEIPAKAEKAPVKKEAAPKKAAKPEKKPESKPKAAKKPAAKAEKKPEPKGAKPAPPANRKALDAMVAEKGADAALEALTKVKVVDLRALAREYNGEFGIAGREIRNANKKVLIEEFKAFYKK